MADYDHMENAWGYPGNPYLAAGISTSADEPHSQDVFADIERQFRNKVLRGALQGGRQHQYLWSIGQMGNDTGFGKTALMRAYVREINADWGQDAQERLGMKPERRAPVVAAFTAVDETGHNGLFPVLFAAAQAMASGPDAVLPQARELIAEQVGEDPRAIRTAVLQARMRLAPAGPPPREELLYAFGSSADEFADALSKVTEFTQIRSGIQHFAFVLYVLAAAGVKKCFLMIDQMEDLGKKGAITAAKRRREIGRFRDMLEAEPYASMLHLTFTLHQAAADILAEDWERNRLPDFYPVRSNSSAVVVLNGIEEDDQVEALLGAWMERMIGPLESTAPWRPSAFTALRHSSEGRPGRLLLKAAEVWDAASDEGLGSIDGGFVREHLGDDELAVTPSGSGGGFDDGAPGPSVADTLLS